LTCQTGYFGGGVDLSDGVSGGLGFAKPARVVFLASGIAKSRVCALPMGAVSSQPGLGSYIAHPGWETWLKNTYVETGEMEYAVGRVIGRAQRCVQGNRFCARTASRGRQPRRAPTSAHVKNWWELVRLVRTQQIGRDSAELESLRRIKVR